MQSEEYAELAALQAKIAISNSQLISLAHNQQYFQKTFNKLRQQAIEAIKQNPREALISFSEAQKILQYVASCGMNINKYMIMFILHNQACCYQQLWSLEKCSNYLEALIYNISSNFDTKTPTPIQQIEGLANSRRYFMESNQLFRGKPINNRIELSEYHLQFCAINSQIGNHNIAKRSAKESIAIIRDIFQQLSDILTNTHSKENILMETPQTPTILKIIKGVSEMPKQFSISKRNYYTSTVQYYIEQWSMRKEQVNNQLLKEALKNFSIGHIMKLRVVEQINHCIQKKSGFYSSFPTQFQTNFHRKSHKPNQMDYIDSLNIMNVTHKIILLAISYFTYATQIRLMALQIYGSDKQKLKKTEYFNQSEIYTLISMITLLVYVPYDMLLIKHIFTSYTANYRDIFTNNEESSLGKALKNQFDFTGYGVFNKEERNIDLTQIYHKKSSVVEFTDEMKTVNFTIVNRDTRRQSYGSLKKQSSRSKNLKIHFLPQNKKNQNKLRAKSQTLKRQQITIQNTSNNVNTQIDNKKSTPLKYKSPPKKRRSLTSFKNSKIDKIIINNKQQKNRGNNKKLEEGLNTDYYFQNTQKVKTKSPEVKTSRKVKRRKSETQRKMIKLISPKTKKQLKLKKK